MTERQSVMQELNKLDVATLNRLLKLSKQIIVPDQEALISVGMDDLVGYAHDSADVNFKQWTDRSKSDFGEFLVEVWSLQSWKNFVYMNIYHKEAFDRQAKVYSHVAWHAIRNGYMPRQHKSSGTFMDITFTGVPNPVVYPAGSFEVSYGNTNLIFTNASDVNVAAGDSVVNVEMKSGRLTSDTGNFNGKSIRVSGVNIDPESIILQIGGDFWTKVVSFATYDANAKVFRVEPSDGIDLEVSFGMGGYGQRPANGVPFVIYYRLDNVADKNKVIGPVSISKNVLNSYITGAVMTSDATGGGVAEDIESIRENSSMLYRAIGSLRVVNAGDAVRILESHPDVYRATAFNFANSLFYAVIPKSGVAADMPFLNTVTNDLGLNDIVGMDFRDSLNPSLTNYVDIASINATAYVYNEFNSADVENQIRDYIEFITNPLEDARYGVGLDLGQVAMALKERIGGLSNFVFNTVNGNPAANIDLTPLQIFNVINQANLTINIILVS